MKKMVGKILLITLSIVNLSFGAGVGTTALGFLKIPPSARAAAMAGAFSAVCDDMYSIYWNPAGLLNLEKKQISATFLQYFQDVNYGFLGFANPLENSAVGVGYTYLVVNNIEARKEDMLEPDRTFKAEDTALAVSYAKKDISPSLLENLNVGANIKFIGSEIDQKSAYTLAVDISGLYEPTKNISVGLGLHNISWGLKFVEKSDPLPLDLKLGLGWVVTENFLLASDIDAYILDNKFYVAFGTEYRLFEKFALRAGYKYGYHTESLGSIVGISAGFGFKFRFLDLDYAFLPFGDLGNTHRLTLIVSF